MELASYDERLVAAARLLGIAQRSEKPVSFVEGRRRSVILAFWNDTVPISQDKIGLKVLKSKIIRLIPGSSPRGFASLGRGRDEVPVAAKLKRNLALSPTSYFYFQPNTPASCPEECNGEAAGNG
jgi:hypothetical protein